MEKVKSPSGGFTFFSEIMLTKATFILEWRSSLKESEGVTPKQVADIRQFNRDYVLILGILNQNMKSLPFSLTQGRIIFEVGAGGEVIANQLAQKLGLDRSYLTRLVNQLTQAGLIEKKASPRDARVKLLQLTTAGHMALAEINRQNDGLTSALFTKFSAAELQQITASMTLITTRLNKK